MMSKAYLLARLRHQSIAARNVTVTDRHGRLWIGRAEDIADDIETNGDERERYDLE